MAKLPTLTGKIRILSPFEETVYELDLYSFRIGHARKSSEARLQKQFVMLQQNINTSSSMFTSEETLIKHGEEYAFLEVVRAPRPVGVTIRALFLDKPSGPVLQILGTMYKIEPFFFSSSLNWIPTRYHETIPKSNGDHLILVREILAVHMIRSSNGNTIISFHPNNSRSTASLHLRSRVIDAGSSVYWANILKATHDPTFVLLIYMWYAMYAWDEALEQLYIYISKLLFSSVNLNDSVQMRRLTQVAVRDSRAMKQVSILTMVFLPASFVASAFGMNITALSASPDIKGTLEHYIEIAIPLTLLTIWFIVASQVDAPVGSRGLQRLVWPYTTLKRILAPETVLDITLEELREDSRLDAGV
ncbi:hypothetical protein C0995_016390 [Termitomyces sp. Mi166|nr:hypothetical protein C0995_016390 [Termitomyces sp. Mi166\